MKTATSTARRVGRHGLHLIKCGACEREVSKNAASCPHCGEPMAAPKQSATGLLAAILLALIVGGVLYLVITDLPL